MDSFVRPDLPLWTTRGDGSVRIRMGASNVEKFEPRTVMEVVEGTCRRVPLHPALAVEDGHGGWRFTTYGVICLLSYSLMIIGVS
jgi:hypothetical protein